MPKVKEPLSKRLLSYEKEFGENIFSSDGEVLRCKCCDKNVVADQRSQVQQHVETKMHRQAIERRKSVPSSSTPLLTNFVKQSEKQKNFHRDLCTTFMAADIPLYKINHPSIRKFLSSYVPNLNTPSETTLRNEVKQAYDNCMDKIRSAIGTNAIYIVVDETTDNLNRYVCNVLVGSLSSDTSSEPFLIHSAILASTNSSSVASTINDALILLWPHGIQYSKVLLLLSDAAPYMRKVGTVLALLYPKLTHVTCLAHALHLVCEIIRARFSEVNELIACFKQILVKAPYRRMTFVQKTGLNLPPKPIVTRWGTWISAVAYFADNFDKLKTFVNELHEDAISIQTTKTLLQSASLPTSLIFISTHFGDLPQSITQLEKNGLPLSDSIQIIEALNQRLVTAGDSTTFALEKLNQCLSKNPGWNLMLKINKILQGVPEPIPKHLSTSEVGLFKFAPLTSVSVERSFSEFKAFMRTNRCSFSEENLRYHLILLFNEKRL